MRCWLIFAGLLSVVPVSAIAQARAPLSLPAQGYTAPKQQSGQAPVTDMRQPVCLRDADTRKMVCHTLAEWKWLAINRDRRSLDAK